MSDGTQLLEAIDAGNRLRPAKLFHRKGTICVNALPRSQHNAPTRGPKLTRLHITQPSVVVV